MSISPVFGSPLWSDQPGLLRDLAIADLEGAGDVQPTLVAFAGPQALFLATLRPFAKGAYHDPIIEVGAVAAGLAADRLLLSLSGRAWSMADPIPPVLGDGEDLRQRVITLHDVDGTAADTTVTTTIIPFDVAEDCGEVTTGQVMTLTGGQGWVPQALTAIVERREAAATNLEDVGKQIVRCERLGHRLAWSLELTGLVSHPSAPNQTWSAESRAKYLAVA